MYSYQNEKYKIFKEENQIMFLSIRDTACKMLRESGCFMMGKVISESSASGDMWTMLACVDRLVEILELKEILYNKHSGQDRIFIRGDKWI